MISVNAPHRRAGPAPGGRAAHLPTRARSTPCIALGLAALLAAELAAGPTACAIEERRPTSSSSASAGEVSRTALPATSDPLPVGHAAADRDGDGRLAADEFDTHWRGSSLFRHWRESATVGVGPADFAHRVYRVWDRYGEGLTEAEWARGVRGWFGRGANVGVFLDWDANLDLVIDQYEFADAADRFGLAAAWDSNRDGRIDEREYEAGIFRVFDDDRDGYVRDREWRGGHEWNWDN